MIRAFKKNPDMFVSLNFLSAGLTLSALQKISGQQSAPLFSLHAFTTVAFSDDEYSQGRMYNPTRIGNYIAKFISMHSMKKRPIACTITGNHIIEQFLESEPTIRQSAHKQQLLIDSCPLHPQAHDTYMNYVCAIERSTILQYQLLAIVHKLNLKIISTKAMAYLNLYRYLHNNSAADDSLARILEKHHNDLSLLIHPQRIASMVQIPAHLEKSINNLEEISIALGAIIPFLISERRL